MSKIIGWLVILIGILWTLPLMQISIGAELTAWLIGLAILAIGIIKIVKKPESSGTI